MKKVYTHENRFLVWNAKHLLEEAGIACSVRNEYSSGGVGDLSPFETWPELWVDDASAERALALIAGLLERQQESGDEWRCPQCGEMNDSSFELCWKCGHDRNANE